LGENFAGDSLITWAAKKKGMSTVLFVQCFGNEGKVFGGPTLCWAVLSARNEGKKRDVFLDLKITLEFMDAGGVDVKEDGEGFRVGLESGGEMEIVVDVMGFWGVFG
tara:strand:- start:131 stop:451 length:321 start_codon:yes stop_codon:yes gene_type:complete